MLMLKDLSGNRLYDLTSLLRYGGLAFARLRGTNL
jgi:hypothetical protein